MLVDFETEVLPGSNVTLVPRHRSRLTEPGIQEELGQRVPVVHPAMGLPSLGGAAEDEVLDEAPQWRTLARAERLRPHHLLDDIGNGIIVMCNRARIHTTLGDMVHVEPAAAFEVGGGDAMDATRL